MSEENRQPTRKVLKFKVPPEARPPEAGPDDEAALTKPPPAPTAPPPAPTVRPAQVPTADPLPVEYTLQELEGGWSAPDESEP